PEERLHRLGLLRHFERNSNATLFFQAEDGIRGRNVTGVQTCALPIFRVLEKQGRSGEARALAVVPGGLENASDSGVAHAGVSDRSEERRVGKEGGARWGS